MRINTSTAFDANGKWWLPELDSEKKQGKLFYNPIGPSKLHLQDSFYSSMDSPQALIIHGQLNDGQFCTLIETYSTNITSYFGSGETSSQIIFNKAYIGSDLLSSPDPMCESLTVGYSYLDSWLNKSPIEETRISMSEGSIKYKKLNDIVIKLTNLKTKLTIFTNPISHTDGNSVSLTIDSKIFIRPRKKQKLSWFLDISYKLRIMLTLLVGRPVSISNLYLTLGKKRYVENGKIRFIGFPGSFIFSQSGQINSKDETIYPWDMAFPFTEIEDSIDKIFNNWFNKSESIQSVYDLFFIISIGSKLPIDFKFITLLQSIEAYSRYRGQNEYLSRDEYAPFFDTMCSSIPDEILNDHREALKARLRYGNQFSLRKRLNILLGGLDLRILNQLEISKSEFIGKVVDTRNYLTHRDDINRNNILTIGERHDYTKVLHLILNYFLFIELGISERKIIGKITHPNFLRNSRY